MNGGLYTPVKAIKDAIYQAFDTFAKIETLRRCTRGLTQNVNESGHARLYTICKKSEHFGFRRLVFAAQVVSVEHNYGKYYGSLARTFGLTQSEMLRERDDEMARSSSRGHWYNPHAKLVKGSKEVIEYAYGFGFDDETPLDELLGGQKYRSIPQH